MRQCWTCGRTEEDDGIKLARVINQACYKVRRSELVCSDCCYECEYNTTCEIARWFKSKPDYLD